MVLIRCTFPARNVILFTYIIDNIPKPASVISSGHVDKHLNTLWNIFYHIYLPNDDVAVLQDHASRLVTISETIATWSSSQYGNAVNFISEASLAELRRFWQKYAETELYSREEVVSFEASARSGLASINEELLNPMAGGLRGYRSTGAHSLSSAESMQDAMKAYWRTGVVAGNSRDVAALDSTVNGRLNPTMVISSTSDGTFPVDYEHDPLHGFHLAEVFDTDMTSAQRQERLAAVAKAQFRAWCHSFAKYIHRDKVNIMIHSGDAVNLCYTLQDFHCGETGLPQFTHFYNRPWSAQPLSLIGSHQGRPKSEAFDVIHTSNLIDHVGLLNILPATIPLLSHKPFSIIFTECHILAAEDPTETLDALLFADATTFSLLLGLASVAHLTGFCTDSVGIEAHHHKYSKEAKGLRDLRMLIPWKWPATGDAHALEASSGNSNCLLKPVRMDPEDLAHWFFQVYLSMFNYESVFPLPLEESFSSIVLIDSTKPSFGVSADQRLAGDMRYYSRTNLVVLIRLIKMRVHTDWEACVSSLVLKMKGQDDFYFSRHVYIEFLTRLHLFGLCQDQILNEHLYPQSPNFDRQLRAADGGTGVLQRSTLPQYVYVALVVPRSCLEPFTGVIPSQATTPRLYLSLESEDLFEHHFFGVDCFFGNLKAVPGMIGRCVMEEDNKGWYGHEDLIVSCLVPSRILLMDPHSSTHVLLKVFKSPTSISRYGAKLGEKMIVFGCGLTNNRLWILDDIPGVLEDQSCLTDIPKLPPLRPRDSATPMVALKEDGTVKHIAIKLQFPPQATESKLLKEGAKVAATQISPCVLQLKIGKVSLKLIYPYPVNGNKSVTQVSRERFCVQVAAPPSSARMPGGLEQNPFPVILQGRHPVPWNIPRLAIDQQPQVANPLAFNCLLHVSLTTSEDDARYTTLSGVKGAFATLKQRLISFFTGLTGQHPSALGTSCKAYAIQHGTNGISIDTFVFTHAIHHDRDSGSLFLEAFVVPVSLPRMSNLVEHFRGLTDVTWLSMGDLELSFWKQLLPACVERCRQTWDHKSTCPYLVKGRIPLSTKPLEPSICRCGEGQDVTNFPAHLPRLASIATRIAIPLLSAVPYVEPMPPTFSPKEIASYDPRTQYRVHIPGRLKPDTPHCALCGKVEERLQRCSGCHKATYCSRECQKAAWKEHKQICGKSSGTEAAAT